MKAQRNPTFWAYSAQISGLFGFALLPLLLHVFPVEKVALWFLILTIGSIASLADQSLEPVITRHITYARKGVKNIPRYGEPPEVGDGDPDPKALVNVISSARQLYAWIAAVNVLVFGTGGAWYLGAVAAKSGIGTEASWAWGLFVSAQSIGSLLAVNIPILLAMEQPTDAFASLTIQRISFLVAAAIGLSVRPCLQVLGVAQFFGVLVGLGTARFRAGHLLAKLSNRPDTKTSRAYAREIFRGCSRLWITRGGAFLIAKSNLLLVSIFLGLPSSGRLALSMQALEALNIISCTPLYSRLPRLYELKTLEHKEALKRQIGHIHLMGWSTFILGSLSLLWLGDPLLKALGSQSSLLYRRELSLILITGFLEMNHSLSATLLILGNKIPFVRASVASGIAIISISGLILSRTSVGMFGVLLVPFLVQLAYNNWKWPFEALRFFDTSYGELMRLGWTRRP